MAAKDRLLCYFKLVTANADQTGEQKVVYSSTKTFYIGRNASSANSLHISRKNTSRKHALIFAENGAFYIRCFSKNGAFVDENFLSSWHKPVPLCSGSLVQISGVLIYFLLPKRSLPLEKCDFEAFLALGRIRDPLADLKDVALVDGEKYLADSVGDGEVVNFVRTSAFKDKESFRLFYRVLRAYGALKWDEIIKETAQNGLKISQIECRIAVVLILTRLCGQSFAKGLLDCSKKLAAIIRRESQLGDCVLEPEDALRLEKVVEEVVLYSEELSNEFVSRYYLNMVLADEKHVPAIFDKLNKTLPAIPGWTMANDTELLRVVNDNGLYSFDDLINSVKFPPDFAPEKKAKSAFLRQRFSAIISSAIQCADSIRKISLSGGAASKLSAKWSVKEHFDLLRALQTFGRPRSEEDFDRIKKTEKFKKTAAEIKKRALLFVDVAENAIKSNFVDKHNPFGLTLKGAVNLEERFKMIESLRKILKLKNNDIALSERLDSFENNPKMPFWWNKADFDLCLLKGILSHGFGNWAVIRTDPALCFNTVPLSSFKSCEPHVYERAVNLIQYLGTDFKRNKAFSKSAASDSQSDEARRNMAAMLPPQSAFAVHCNLAPSTPKWPGELQKPLFSPKMISLSLVFLNPGKIDPSRPKFHNTKNLFPIGFKTIRKYISYVDPSKNCKYVNEIADGGAQPVFIVTCEHDPSSPIRELNPTAAWEVVNMRIRARMPAKNVISAIDGFERFGLNEAAVERELESLPGAEKCAMYKRIAVAQQFGLGRRAVPPGAFFGVPPPPQGAGGV